MSMRKIKLGEKEVLAQEIGFETEKENWNIYLLEDGTTLKVKAVLAEVLRVQGEYAPNGDPIYIINATPVLSSTSPEQLRKK
jgi:hypothetical protein